MVSPVQDHFLVPKHYLLPKEQAQKILQELDLGSEKLPRILKNDPAIKELVAEKGDVIKIVRNSPTAGKTIYFRRVA